MKGENSVREYLESFMAEFEYPLNATDELLLAYDKLNSSSPREFSDMISEYNISNKINYELFEENIKQISKSADINEYTGALVLLLCLTKRLREYYCESGISEDIFRNTVLDLRYKLDECICVHGVLGTFVLKWFWGFFRLERFALGRLQFEIVRFGGDYEIDGVSLTPDSLVINVHIPRTGTRLDRESVLESYRLAAEFYRAILGDKIVFVCSSWLLFPKNRELLSPTSNLLAFMNDFDIYTSGEYLNYGEVWRLFDKAYDGDVTHLPADTSLRRAYIDLISRGEKTGWGKGVFVYRD